VRALRDASLPDLEALARRNPRDAGVLYQLGLRQRQAGQTDEAAETLVRAAQQSGADEKIWLALADLYRENGSAAQAVQVLSTYLNAHPKSARTHLLLAKTYQQARVYDKAYEEAKAATVLDPRNVEAWRIQARAAKNTQQYYEAASALRQVIARDKTDWNVRAELGDFLVYLRREQEAIPFLREAVRLAPTEPLPHMMLGQVLLKVATSPAEVQEAQQSVFQSLRLNPEVPAAYLLLAQSYARQTAGKKHAKRTPAWTGCRLRRILTCRWPARTVLPRCSSTWGTKRERVAKSNAEKRCRRTKPRSRRYPSRSYAHRTPRPHASGWRACTFGMARRALPRAFTGVCSTTPQA
jgi:predicted Zn-dependent protease